MRVSHSRGLTEAPPPNTDEREGMRPTEKTEKQDSLRVGAFFGGALALYTLIALAIYLGVSAII